MKLETELYQNKIWPKQGKHILAQSTDDYVVVYQAYKEKIGHYAADKQYFGGDFSYSRMSWIKTNFLWMMYRSGWGTKPNQEVTLAVYLKRDFFEKILINAFPSSNPENMNHESWKEQISKTDVRLQWDPDHCPYGTKLERRAIQLGLRNDFLLPFKGEGIVKVEDISSFVKEQRKHVENQELNKLIIPKERIFCVNEKTRLRLAM